MKKIPSPCDLKFDFSVLHASSVFFFTSSSIETHKARTRRNSLICKRDKASEFFFLGFKLVQFILESE